MSTGRPGCAPPQTAARLEAQQRQVLDEIESFRGADRLDRDELHGRAVR